MGRSFVLRRELCTATITNLSMSIASNLVLLFLLLHLRMLNVNGSRSHFSTTKQASDNDSINIFNVHAIKKPETMGIRNHERMNMEVESVAQEKAKSSGAGNSALVGSTPPTCISKCGSCKPICAPVRVPVQPGTPNNSEYYPEAWRCKCGGKLYMP
eukprot:c21934_g1_i1 orf=609-1079(-)